VRLQVLSTPRRHEADAKAAELVRAGYRPIVEPADLGERGTWYRLRLEGFDGTAQATAAGKRLQAEGLIREFWIVR
jgi:cell division protein FtsN